MACYSSSVFLLKNQRFPKEADAIIRHNAPDFYARDSRKNNQSNNEEGIYSCIIVYLH